MVRRERVGRGEVGSVAAFQDASRHGEDVVRMLGHECAQIAPALGHPSAVVEDRHDVGEPSCIDALEARTVLAGHALELACGDERTLGGGEFPEGAPVLRAEEVAEREQAHLVHRLGDEDP